MIVGNFYTYKDSTHDFIFKYTNCDYDEINGTHFIDKDYPHRNKKRLQQNEDICGKSDVKYISPASIEDIKKYYNIDLTYQIKTTLLC